MMNYPASNQSIKFMGFSRCICRKQGLALRGCSSAALREFGARLFFLNSAQISEKSFVKLEESSVLVQSKTAAL